MTPLSSTPLKRVCPGITSEADGRPLVVELIDTEGGTMRMKWKGRKGEPIDVSLSDLMAFAEGKVEAETPAPAPAPSKAGSVRWTDLKSRAHTIPCENVPVRVALISLITDLEIYHAWMEAGQPCSWSSWKEKTNQPEQ